MSFCSRYCCGCYSSNGDDSHVTGRQQSLVLVGLSMLLSFLYQYSLAPVLGPGNSNWIVDTPDVGSFLVDSWNDGCEEDSEALQKDCRGNTGVYRVTFFSGLFFIFFGIMSYRNPTFNRKNWSSKYTLYILCVLASIFIPNQPLFLDIYVPIARVGASLFIVFQQLVLIDFAYRWNENWVQKSNEADFAEFGSGNKWLQAILAACGILFTLSFTGLILLWHGFNGCATNEAFIIVTGVMILLTTVVQLFSEQASLLTSAVIAIYSTSLLFSAVSKNPNGSCNPRLGKDDPLGIFIGFALTSLFLLWAGYAATKVVSADSSSTTAHVLETGGVTTDNLEYEENTSDVALVNDEDAEGSMSQMERPLVSGVITNPESDSDTRNSHRSNRSGTLTITTDVASVIWQLNTVLALLTYWMAMSFTEWGTVSGEGTVANPDSGDVNMWMIISSQWLTFALYFWTIAAPMLFPDRDFS